MVKIFEPVKLNFLHVEEYAGVDLVNQAGIETLAILQDAAVFRIQLVVEDTGKSRAAIGLVDVHGWSNIFHATTGVF